MASTGLARKHDNNKPHNYSTIQILILSMWYYYLQVWSEAIIKNAHFGHRDVNINKNRFGRGVNLKNIYYILCISDVYVICFTF